MLAKGLFLAIAHEIMNTQEFSNIITTLVTNGFHIIQVDRISTENIIINIYRYDKLGAEIRYSILFSEDKYETSIINILISIAKKQKSNPILINDYINTAECAFYTKEKFFDFFGGIINTGLILISNLTDILDRLGHNKLIDEINGEPNDLHEIYVSECLQFIMNSPTRRFGRERLFESLPDVVVLSKDGFMILIDSKSYADGFDFKSDDIKRFASYVIDFEKRYSQYFGRIFSFTVISGHFNDSIDSLSNRSNDLYKLCNCKLSCIKSIELAKIVRLIQTKPELRGSINWQNIFSELIIETKMIQQELNRILKDKIH